ncbi:MAG TPA: archease [Anaerolineales bacterium]|nr:archease [Anaerolineales bacterium]
MATTSMAGFEEIEHTADWSLRVWAPDLAGLLEQAARGMLNLSGIRLVEGKRQQRELTVESTDAEGLLVNFLGELLHILEQEGLAFDEYELTLAENAVRAKLHGAPVMARKEEIKGVTYHDLRIEQKSTGLEALIVFDV